MGLGSDIPFARGRTFKASIGAAGGAARRPNQTPTPIRPKGSSATTASPDLDRPSIASEGPGEPCLCTSLCLLTRRE